MSAQKPADPLQARPYNPAMPNSAAIPAEQLRLSATRQQRCTEA